MDKLVKEIKENSKTLSSSINKTSRVPKIINLKAILEQKPKNTIRLSPEQKSHKHELLNYILGYAQNEYQLD